MFYQQTETTKLQSHTQTDRRGYQANTRNKIKHVHTHPEMLTQVCAHKNTLARTNSRTRVHQHCWNQLSSPSTMTAKINKSFTHGHIMQPGHNIQCHPLLHVCASSRTLETMDHRLSWPVEVHARDESCITDRPNLSSTLLLCARFLLPDPLPSP